MVTSDMLITYNSFKTFLEEFIKMTFDIKEIIEITFDLEAKPMYTLKGIEDTVGYLFG